MPQARHVALIRGINVGGKNIIKMAELAACFEGLGLREVQTYIQSGNVLFSSQRASKSALSRKIERAIDAGFGCATCVVVVTADELTEIIAQAPVGFGKQPARYRYDVLFVRPPLSPARVVDDVPVKPGVDAVHAGEHVLYFRRLIKKATESHLSKLVQRPVYKSITARNWNTTTKLAALLAR